MNAKKGKATPGPWIAKLYEPDEDDRPHWGVRQSPDAASVSVDGEALPCGFGICNIVEQDMEDVENGEERANAELIAAAPELLEALQNLLEQFQKWEGYHQWGEEDEIAADEAKAALTKAESPEIRNPNSDDH